MRDLRTERRVRRKARRCAHTETFCALFSVYKTCQNCVLCTKTHHLHMAKIITMLNQCRKGRGWHVRADVDTGIPCQQSWKQLTWIYMAHTILKVLFLRSKAALSLGRCPIFSAASSSARSCIPHLQALDLHPLTTHILTLLISPRRITSAMSQPIASQPGRTFKRMPR